MEDAVDTKGESLFPPGHIDKSGSAYDLPIPFWQHVGGSTLEVIATPSGVVGSATLASADKAKPGVEAILDYLETLVNDILEMYPAGKLPPADRLSQRDPAELEAVLKGPYEPGGRHIYTIATRRRRCAVLFVGDKTKEIVPWRRRKMPHRSDQA